MNNNFLQLKMPDAAVFYKPDFYNETKANKYFDELLNKIAWQQDRIKIFGKEILIPRLQAFYGDEGLSYKYSNINLKATKWNDVLLNIKNDIESSTKVKCNSVLLNLYRTGNDSNGWHADDEPSLGKSPEITSLSLGANRHFSFKHKINKSLKAKIELQNGSLLVMKGKTQHFWYHQIAKTKRPVKPRINLTFRFII